MSDSGHSHGHLYLYFFREYKPVFIINMFISAYFVKEVIYLYSHNHVFSLVSGTNLNIVYNISSGLSKREEIFFIKKLI